ncbi:histidine phosphatase family protein [Mesorhizobium sp. CAU 1741]|uniref:histidine phosphatase family protein n=1 Tax=Mesorhizobium sp. CAU 1741 TaxID=3140366 RepID=UPI00325AFA73
MQKLVYFVRHGQTDWNAEGRLQGQADTDLNATGRQQASRNGDLLRELVPDPTRFDFVSSPLRRTRQTMERIRAAMGLEADGYRTDPRLMELHFGDWQGHTFAELEALEPGCYERRERDKWGFVPPGAGAESYASLAERVRPFFEDIAADTICVAHGGILRSVLWLTNTMTPAECAAMSVPQDRILRLRNGVAEWL